MAKTKEEPAKAPAAPSLGKSILGYLIGAALGLVALFLLSSLLRTPPLPQDELPHLAILVEPAGATSFHDDVPRKALCKLQRDLAALGDLGVLGPLDYPVLRPGPTKADLPVARSLDTLTAAEIHDAAPFFGVGGYLVPRVFAPDLQSAVVRAWPRDMARGFSRAAGKRIQAILDEVNAEGVLKVSPYSTALQLYSGPDVKAKLNLHFGVQTVVVRFLPAAGKAPDSAEVMRDVYLAMRGFARPTVRSMTSDGSFLHYACAVQVGEWAYPTIEGVPLEQLEKYADLARSAKVTMWPGVLLATDAEGMANRDLGYDFRANRKSPASGQFAFHRGH